jgi:uncharacterized protein
VVSLLAPGAALPANHPAAGKTQVDGKPTAYVCTNATCGAPLIDPTALHDHLATSKRR